VAETVRLLRELLATWPNFAISRICTTRRTPGTGLIDRARALGYEVPSASRLEPLRASRACISRPTAIRAQGHINLSFVSFFLDKRSTTTDPVVGAARYSAYACVARLRFSAGWWIGCLERRLYEWWIRRGRSWPCEAPLASPDFK